MTLRERDRQEEWMDQPDLDASLHAEALRGLARVNRISGSVGSIWKPIEKLGKQITDRPLRVLDVACGGGDVAIGLKRKADQNGLDLEVTGCDISPTACRHAAERAESLGVDVSFIQCDAIGGRLPTGFDAVYCSLFVHHLEGEQIVQLLRSMGDASCGQVIVNDLVRSSFGYLIAKWGIRLLTSSRVCHVDAPLSVKAALTVDEILGYVQAAGLDLLSIRKVFPERFVLICSASDASHPITDSVD